MPANGRADMKTTNSVDSSQLPRPGAKAQRDRGTKQQNICASVPLSLCPPASTDNCQLSTRFPLTVIVLTHNEADNIAPCLATVDWAEELIVVDSGSSDGTLDHALHVRPDVRAFSHPLHKGARSASKGFDFGRQRNWALDETSPQHDWILFLDADERCTPECAESVRKAVMGPGEFVGFYLTCRNYFLGRWIKHCTLYPSWQLRLLKTGCVRYRREGHGQCEVTDGPLGYICEPYDHFGFSKGVAHWIDRHNGYSSAEVDLIRRLRREPLQLGHLIRRDPVQRRRCLKRLAARIGGRPLFRFLYSYVLRGGFLDGRPGLLFCLLRAAHEIHITAKLTEAEKHVETVDSVMSPSANRATRYSKSLEQ